MVTLGRKHGLAGRAARGAIAAGMVIGVAACGHTAAGASGAAKPAGAAASSAKSAVSKINPGGPMLPPGGAQHAALCGAIPTLTRMVFTRTVVPSQRVREALPGGLTVRDTVTVRRVATLLCALPVMRSGLMSCPNLAGGSNRLFFAAGHRAFPVVAVQLSGCRVVTGLGMVRSWTASTRLEHELSQSFGGLRLVPPNA